MLFGLFIYFQEIENKLTNRSSRTGHSVGKTPVSWAPARQAGQAVGLAQPVAFCTKFWIINYINEPNQ